MAPLIVITGPTASGKTGLALELAERYHGEIICADSRTVYKGMDIGTAKPTADEQARVPHHLLDVAEPNERFTAGDFQRLTRMAIDDIRVRGKVPFLVGGTGLYIDSVVLDFEFSDTPVNEAERERLSGLSVEMLALLLKKHHIEFPTDLSNKRHLIRAWEQRGVNRKRRESPLEDTVVVSITTDKALLEERIRVRAQEMFESGVVEEARRLGEEYGWECESMTGNIYPILHEVLEGRLSEEEAIERFVIRDRQLAKRQVTWLKRHDFVRQLSLEEARGYLGQILDRVAS